MTKLLNSNRYYPTKDKIERMKLEFISEGFPEEQAEYMSNNATCSYFPANENVKYDAEVMAEMEKDCDEELRELLDPSFLDDEDITDDLSISWGSLNIFFDKN
jgi:hypothetical protein